VRRALVVLVALVAGCHDNDPCAGKSGACVTIEATGSGIPLLDDLAINVRDNSGAEQTGTAMSGGADKIALPVQVAALLRAGSSGTLGVYVAGEINQAVIADGFQSVTLSASGHAHVTVQLALRGGGDDLAGGGGDSGGDLATANGPTLTPSRLELQVVKLQTGRVIYTATTPVDVMLGPITIFPSANTVTVDPGTTCANGMTLHAFTSCSVVIAYAPVGPESLVQQVQLTTSLGTPTATLRARCPGLINETLPIGTPPTFEAVYAVDALHAWAVGDNNAVYHRNSGGWASIAGPSSGAKLDSVYAASDTDVYVASSSLLKIFHSGDGGATWQSLASGLVGTVNALAGVDAQTVYAAGGQGDIVVGSAAAGWQNDKASDTLPFDDLTVFAGNVWAARSDQLLLRDPTMATKWGAYLDTTSNAHFNGVWGSTTTDAYGAGTKIPCVAGNGCGILYHKAGAMAPTVSPVLNNCDSFNDIFGDPIGVTFNVYAVGGNGTFVTTPNGDSWSILTTGTTSSLNGVHGADGDVYVVGAGGTILHWIE
jgi:hypothetical protein